MPYVSIPGGYMSRSIWVDEEQAAAPAPSQPANYVGVPPKMEYTPENTEQECDNYFINESTGKKVCLSSGGGGQQAVQQPGRTPSARQELAEGWEFMPSGGGRGQENLTQWGTNRGGGGTAPRAPASGTGRVQSGSGGGSPGNYGTPPGGNVATPPTYDPALLAQANTQAQNVGTYANNIAGVAGQVPTMGAPNYAMPERSLYDRYAQHLMNPADFANDPMYQAALQQAQQASGRQLAAGRMSKSGNAAIQAAQVAGQTFMDQYGQRAQMLSGGAGQELSRGTAGANIQQNNYRDLMDRYKTEGALYGQAGSTAAGAANILNDQAKIGAPAPASGPAPSINDANPAAYNASVTNAHLYNTGQTGSSAGWVNPYARYPGDYRANMTQRQLEEAMRPKLVGGVPGYQTYNMPTYGGSYYG